MRTAARPEHAALGRLLRGRREELGLSQREVAARLERTQAYIWKVEQGLQHIDIPTLIDLSGVLQIKASDLISAIEQ